jgi:hypothetical protein
MLRTSVLAALSVAMLTVAAPAAHAAPASAVCGGVAVSNGVAGGYTAVLYGVATFTDTGTHTLRCYVQLVGGTPGVTGTGTGVVAAAGPVSFGTAPPNVQECMEIDSVTVECHSMPVVGIPDRTVLDPIVCPILKALAPGLPPVVTIQPDGDLYVFSTGRLYDCPPYS